MSPEDGAYLGRGMLACAAALCGPNPPESGTVIANVSLPVTKWVVGSDANGGIVLALTIPSGIELTFQMPQHGAMAIGVALAAQAEGSAKGHSGTIH